MSTIPPAMSTDQLLADVRAVVLRELENLAPSRLVLRLDDVGDRSVFVVARLGDETGSVMVARVYEADLHRDGAVLQPVYLSDRDAEAFVVAMSEQPRPRRRVTPARP